MSRALKYLSIPLNVYSFIAPHKPSIHKKENIGSGFERIAKNLNPRPFESHEILGNIRRTPCPWAYNLSTIGDKI